MMRCYAVLDITSHHSIPLDQYFLVATIFPSRAGQTRGPATLSDASFDEDAHLQELTTAGLGAAICFYHTAKLQLDYLRGDIAAALAHIEPAERTSASCVGMFYTGELRFYASLVWSARYAATPDPAERQQIAAKQEPLLAAYVAMADSAPANYRHKLLLIQAEWQRAQDQLSAALPLCQQAITTALEHEFLQDAALAQALAARLLHSLGEGDRAQAARRASRESYLRWGATSLGEE